MTDKVFDEPPEPALADLAYTFPSSNLQAVFERRASNSKQGVNRLPPELLSRIFVTGEEEERVTRPRKAFYKGFQDLATHVCSHWRDVAISNPALWTYIHITRPPPNRLAALYLDRARSTALLDINIETRTRYWDKAKVGISNWMGQVNLMSHLLECLISYGAAVNRWKSLAVCAKRPETMFYILGFLSRNCVSNLRSLSLEWKTNFSMYAEDISSLECLDLIIDWRSLSASALPNLNAVEFIRIPWGFVLDRSLSLLTNLTKLSLTSSSQLSSLSKLRELLSANCSLESLHLNSGFAFGAHSTPEPNPQRVQLLSLRFLSIESPMNAIWILDVVQMIQAPTLEKFALSTITRDEDPQNKWAEIALKYISTGRLPGHIDSAEAASTNESIYPLLRELDISNIDSSDESVAEMLSLFPSVTRLSIAGTQAHLLSRAPWLLPNLFSLRFPNIVHPRLGGILRCRAEAGYPIQVVELPKSWQYKVEDQLPSVITILKHCGSELGLDYDASREESYGWDPEDDFDGYDYALDSKDEWPQKARIDHDDENEGEW